MDDRLKEKRFRIDEINNELIELLDERFNISKEIGNVKKEIGKEVLDTKREEFIIEKLKSKLEKSQYTDEILNIFLTILDESKKVQNK